MTDKKEIIIDDIIKRYNLFKGFIQDFLIEYKEAGNNLPITDDKTAYIFCEIYIVLGEIMSLIKPCLYGYLDKNGTAVNIEHEICILKDMLI